MNEQMREAMSALMDGEAQDLEMRRLVAAADDREVRATWSRYHLVREICEGRTVYARQWDISAAVSAAVAEEGPLKKLPSSASVTPRFWRSINRVAFAASVAMVVVLGAKTLQQPSVISSAELTPDSAPPVAEVSVPVASGKVFPVETLASRGPGGVVVSAGYSPDAPPLGEAEKNQQLRLEQYLLQHTESAALNNGQGLMSFARVVSYQPEE